MISKWGVKNFKSILNANLELAPLTVFCGVNSSGKSAFLRSIAMLAQSVRTDDEQQINLKGDLVDLGSFDHIYCKKAPKHRSKFSDNSTIEEGTVGINFTIEQKEDKTKESNLINFEFEFRGYMGLSAGWQGIRSLYMEHKIIGADNDGVYYIGKNNSIQNMDEPRNSGDALDAVSAGKIKAKFNEMGILHNEDMDLIRKPHICSPKYKHIKGSEKIRYSNFLPERLSFKLKYCEGNRRDQISQATDIFLDLISEFPDEKLPLTPNAYSYAESKLNLHGINDYEDGYYILPEPKDGNQCMQGGVKVGVFAYVFVASLKGILENKDITEKIHHDEIFLIEDIDDYQYYNDFIDNKDLLALAVWYEGISNLDAHEKKIVEDRLKEDSFKDTIKNLMYVTNRSDFDVLYFHYEELPAELKEAQNYLYNFFSSDTGHPCIKYLGPLRVEPKYEYETTSGENICIDAKGENVAAVIDNLKRVDYMVKDFIDSKGQKHPEKRFTEALVHWMNYIEFADEFKTSELKSKERESKESKNVKFELKMNIDGDYYDLPQLGTGVSQILPILVICLASSVGSTIIIETPEEQLHPKVQSKLADFFIAMALSGRQCLIETHSEYIIEQIRYRIIKSPIDVPLHEKVKLYFVSKRDGLSHFEEIETNEFGAQTEWPDDFFDEAHIISSKIMDEVIKKMDSEEVNE